MSIFYLKPPIHAVFIHIPKTGGSSIRSVAYKQYASAACHEDIPANWPRERSFAFVRHPMDRFVSGWAYTGKLDFEYLLKLLCDNNVSPRSASKEGVAKHHLLPQTHPFYYLFRAKHVGRFETFQESFEEICHKLEIPSMVLPKSNTSIRRCWQEEVPHNLIGRIIDIYRDDFDQLGYRIPS